MSEGLQKPVVLVLILVSIRSAQNFYSPSIDQNILHPDVIVDTDNLSDCSSSASLKSGKRKMSTSTDGDSTNYELIEYLKRREKRDEELLKRMDAREERLMNLLERTVIAIEQLAAAKPAYATAAEATATATAAAAAAPVAPAEPSQAEAIKRAATPADAATADVAAANESDAIVLLLPDDNNQELASTPDAATVAAAAAIET